MCMLERNFDRQYFNVSICIFNTCRFPLLLIDPSQLLEPTYTKINIERIGVSMKRISVVSFAVIFCVSIASLTMVTSNLYQPVYSILQKASPSSGLIVSRLDSKLLNLHSFRLLASQIYSAAFNDVSPGFDDLYIIKTQDKGREIIIYCNTNYCYKNRNSLMTS